MIGWLHHVILDCPDPRDLAGFYSEPLGESIGYQSDECVVVASSETSSGLAFQLAPGYLRRPGGSLVLPDTAPAVGMREPRWEPPQRTSFGPFVRI